jgi:hypothetical protein
MFGRLTLALAALTQLSLSACVDPAAERRRCLDSGQCVDDAGEDAGEDAGPLDAGFDGGFIPVVCSSGGWCWEYPFPAGVDLRSVWASADDDVWAAGYDNIAIHYRQGVWSAARLPPGPDALGIPSATCLLPGPEGRVRIADDRSQFYEEEADGGFRSWPTVHGASYGGLGFKTFQTQSCTPGDDGGAWLVGAAFDVTGVAGPCAVEGPVDDLRATFLRNDGDTGSRFLSVQRYGAHGWATTADGLVMRHDGGEWNLESQPSSGLPLRAVLETSDSGWLAGAPGLWRLGPEAWRPVDAPPGDWYALGAWGDWVFAAGTPSYVARCRASAPLEPCGWELLNASHPLYALSSGPTKVFAAGAAGQLYQRTDTVTDGGVWQRLSPGPRADLTDLWLDGNTDGVAVGPGVVLRRTDAGWAEVPLPTSLAFRSALRTSDGTLWLGGDGVLGSLDGGSFEPASVFTASGASFQFGPGRPEGIAAFHSGGPGNTWAVGRAGGIYGYDGAVWRESRPATAAIDLSDVWASDAGTAWAVGGTSSGAQKRVVLYFNGATWRDVTPTSRGNLSYPLNGVWGASALDVTIAGEGGFGLRYTQDGGWEDFNPSGSFASQASITGTPEGELWLSQEDRVLRGRATDAGFSWDTFPLNIAQGFRVGRRVRIGAGRVWVVGTDGFIVTRSLTEP